MSSAAWVVVLAWVGAVAAPFLGAEMTPAHVALYLAAVTLPAVAALFVLRHEERKRKSGQGTPPGAPPDLRVRDGRSHIRTLEIINSRGPAADLHNANVDIDHFTIRHDPQPVAPPSPRIEVEIIRETRKGIRYAVGTSIHLWGLKIRNRGVAADFEARVEVKAGAVTHLASRSWRLTFTQDDKRTARIMSGAEDHVVFGAVIVAPPYSDGIIAKGLWYFDERDRRDTFAQLVPTLGTTVSPNVADFTADFEVAIASDPAMPTFWRRLYRLGPGDEMHDITPPDVTPRVSAPVNPLNLP